MHMCVSECACKCMHGRRKHIESEGLLNTVSAREACEIMRSCPLTHLLQCTSAIHMHVLPFVLYSEPGRRPYGASRARVLYDDVTTLKFEIRGGRNVSRTSTNCTIRQQPQVASDMAANCTRLAIQNHCHKSMYSHRNSS